MRPGLESADVPHAATEPRLLSARMDCYRDAIDSMDNGILCTTVGIRQRLVCWCGVMSVGANPSSL